MGPLREGSRDYFQVGSLNALSLFLVLFLVLVLFLLVLRCILSRNVLAVALAGGAGQNKKNKNQACDVCGRKGHRS